MVGSTDLLVLLSAFGSEWIAADIEVCDDDSATISICIPQTPASFTADGLDCTLYTPHSMRLFGEGFESDQFFVHVEGQVDPLPNGGWSLNQTVVSTQDSNNGWQISAAYGQGYTWTEWLALPGSQGFLQTCTQIEDFHEEWMYYILDEGSMTGYGAYEGMVLTLAHQPANHYLGLQVGLGASTKNGNLGYSAFFLWDDGGSAVGSANIYGDLECAGE